MNKLAMYLERERITKQEFGRRIGVSRTTVSRYCHGHHAPGWHVMPRIEAETKGFVTYRDFYDDVVARVIDAVQP